MHTLIAAFTTGGAMQGKVKWFDVKKGYGFIVSQDGKDLFVHFKDIQGSGFKTLKENEEVTFETSTTEKGLRATNVQRTNPGA